MPSTRCRVATIVQSCFSLNPSILHARSLPILVPARKTSRLGNAYNVGTGLVHQWVTMPTGTSSRALFISVHIPFLSTVVSVSYDLVSIIL